MKLMWKQWGIRHAQPQQASQQWGRQVSRGTSVGLFGVASLISFGDYEIHCLCGSSGCASVYLSMCAWVWPCVLYDRGQYNPKYSKQNHWFPQISLSTHCVLMEAAAAPCHLWSHTRATHQSQRWMDQDRQLFWGEMSPHPTPACLCFHGDFCFGPAGSVLLCLFWSQLTACFTSCISGFTVLLWNANQKPQVTARKGFWLFGCNFGDVFLALKSRNQGEKCSRCFLEELKAFLCAGQVCVCVKTDYLQNCCNSLNWRSADQPALSFLFIS